MNAKQELINYDKPQKKACTKCHRIKPLTEFYARGGKRIGLAWACKHCANVARLEYQRKHSKRLYKKKREKFLANPEKVRASVNRRNALRPQAHRARVQFNRAIKLGKIVRRPCVICDKPESEGHHFDYNKPLEVLWLCTKHHAAFHKHLKDQGL